MIIWKQENGVLAVNSDNDPKVVPKGTEHKKVNTLPESRIFRNAWTFDDIVGVDIDKAIEITKEHIREWRNPQLESLDVQFIRATESGESTDDIIAEKQLLRDATAKADGKTIQELTDLISSTQEK